MNFKKLIQCCLIGGMVTIAVPTNAQQVVQGMSPLHVDGKFLKDDNGNKVVLHGLMDTPSPYFNEYRWGGGATDDNVTGCLNYFKAIFDVITNNEKGAYCNLFRLHLDPAWTNGAANSWPRDDREHYYQENGQTKEYGGEADFSHYDGERLTKYLGKVYIPIAQRALQHGMYVIMRPPGVCPGNIYVGGSYQKYLLDVWDRVSKERLIQKYCGQISLELANEPVSVHLANGQDSKKALHDFFQPIVDKIRENGYKGIIWIPGSGWQSGYADYADYPITGENIGYAVHDYDGWYGCADKNLSPNNVAAATKNKIAQFHNQVPVVDTNPIVITEIDWSPNKPGSGHYNEHNQWVESNYGTWATGRTSVWGKITKGVHDYYGNISMTLSGTHCYIDYNDCITSSDRKNFTLTGRVTPAYKKAMEANGDDPFEACGVACFQWYAEYAQVNYASLERYQPMQEYPEDPFTMSDTWFNPSIIKQGTSTFNTLSSGDYYAVKISKGGLAGWSFEDNIDLSDYQKLVVKMRRNPNTGAKFRIYDSGSLFGDYYQIDIRDNAILDENNRPVLELDLHNLTKASGELLDPSHIRFAGFSTTSDMTMYVSKVYLVKDSTPIEAITVNASADEKGYLDLMGRPVSNPTQGIFIRRSDKKKVYIP